MLHKRFGCDFVGFFAGPPLEPGGCLEGSTEDEDKEI